jgi:hypothetical protein
MKTTWLMVVLGAVALLALGFWLTDRSQIETVQPEVAVDYRNATYMIEGQAVTLRDGVAETEAAPQSAAKVVTRVFGNELVTDLDGDGDEDVALVLTQSTGGSGTFYYAVAALQTPEGYVGSDGYLLGDRIAPQSTERSMNPQHVDVVVFNYAERAPGEAMTTPPSVGKSAYLKIVPETFQWAIVEPDFPGEADVTERYRGVTDEGLVVFEHMNYTSYRLTRNGLVEEGALNTERGYGDDVDATV